ncbi:uncharacterized protein YjlB [Bacillus pakistanensis]|uniref:Uncharacterized protein YjlB n=1 Tax=Rossellomorea pakistanensis TaxID=992288 RepID=A0ABS2NGT3_9BACI|nr:cupin domain-containing protein [Bacillus pakistanensis]MBM7587045.1 uncharacterized protein YjlB [Bacillus pakistanensis]
MEKEKLFYFTDDGNIPNNPKLPVIVYPAAFKSQPEKIEKTFNDNNWLNSWTNGVFDYHHYHSNSHEVLGVKNGFATIQLGGKNGKSIEVNTGDVIVLPAGTGHKRISSSKDFSVVGAYPDGMDHNLKVGEPNERPQVEKDIERVPSPKTDPVLGNDGPLLNYWK